MNMRFPTPTAQVGSLRNACEQLARPSSGCRLLDRYAQFSRGGRQAAVERNQHEVETPGDSEVQRVRRSQPEIDAPNIDVSEPRIRCVDVDRRAHRRTPGIEIRETGGYVGVGQQRHAYQARQARCDFSGGKIAYQQFLINGTEIIVNGFR
jgi:hypothetical protein